MSLEQKTIEWLLQQEALPLCVRSLVGQGVFRLQGAPTNHPATVKELAQCIVFLHCVPEARTAVSAMTSVSVQWAGLAANWDVIEQIFLQEIGLLGQQGVDESGVQLWLDCLLRPDEAEVVSL